MFDGESKVLPASNRPWTLMIRSHGPPQFVTGGVTADDPTKQIPPINVPDMFPDCDWQKELGRTNQAPDAQGPESVQNLMKQIAALQAAQAKMMALQKVSMFHFSSAT